MPSENELFDEVATPTPTPTPEIGTDPITTKQVELHGLIDTHFPPDAPFSWASADQVRNALKELISKL
jgi:hypothetical protein